VSEQPLPFEADMRAILRIYRDAQREIAALVSFAIRAEDLRTARQRRAQLAVVTGRLDQLGAETDSRIRTLIADATLQSAGRTATQIDGLHITAPEITGAFGQASQEAITALEDSILGRLQAARATVGRTIDDVYGRAGRRAALRAILGADGSPRAAKRQLVHDLLRDKQIARAVHEGGFGFVDRSGKRWALDTYAEMATRTITREAVTQGALARMASHKIDLARVSTHAKSCPICLPWEGRLVSLDGQRTEYKGEAVTDLASLPNGGPPFHPQCAHSLAPVAAAVDQTRAQLAGVA
jgi:hypothetical protein